MATRQRQLLRGNPATKESDCTFLQSTITNPLKAVQNVKYRPFIRQQPDRARMSGMGDVSRRMLDPPLILQLDILNPNPPDFQETSSTVTGYLDTQLHNLSNLVLCTVTLLHENEYTIQTFADIPPQPGSVLSRVVTVLMGQTTQNCSYLDINEDKKRHLFIFNNLSVRIQGRFRLSCTIFHLVSGQIDTLVTDVFEVYSPQYYPGMLEPTPLSKWLYIQGISVRAGFHSQETKVVARRKGGDGVSKLVVENRNSKRSKSSESFESKHNKSSESFESKHSKSSESFESHEQEMNSDLTWLWI